VKPTTAIALVLGLACVIVGGVIAYTVHRASHSIEKVESIVYGTGKIMDRVQQVDVDKVRNKAGELSEKATEQTRKSIRVLKDEFKK
jgi:hypothetical protein